jgi:hypothetical protein
MYEPDFHKNKQEIFNLRKKKNKNKENSIKK